MPKKWSGFKAFNPGTLTEISVRALEGRRGPTGLGKSWTHRVTPRESVLARSTRSQHSNPDSRDEALACVLDYDCSEPQNVRQYHTANGQK